MMTPPGDWGRLRELFEAALTVPRQQRAAFLQEHVNGDDALRREIESLVAAHDAAGGFLSVPAMSSDARAVDPPAAGVTRDEPYRLPAGTRLGAFEIVELLGAGGMGEVYRAHDARLDRFVAIKVLSADLDVAHRARERFEREARAISRLSHPRICTVHDIGVAPIDGREVPYLVMELLDGETLAARIAKGPLSIEQATAYAIDIADALVAAHSQGIVHRDLKPANVMVTGSGLKLLDFGLAQLRLPDGAETPVLTGSGITSTGLVFGTVPYMSPEQLRGERVDARTDIFAFGALLHEMLTRQRPFAADSQAALIAAILEHDAPDVSEVQPLAPASLDRVVRKCLAKDPDERWQTARDLKSELVWVRDGREEVRRTRTPIRPARQRRQWRQAIAVWIPTIVALALAVALWLTLSAPSPERLVSKHSLDLPPGFSFYLPINGTSVAIAPDGGRVAFIGDRQGATALFIHTLSAGRPVEVQGTREALSPMFSPDGEWVAFLQARAVKKVPAAGGPVQTIEPAERAGAGPPTWLSDGRIVRGNSVGSPIRLLGSDPKGPGLTQVMPGEDGHVTPFSMRDGSLLFTAMRGGFLGTLSRIMVLRPGAGEAREVVASATSPQLVGDDAIVFARGRSLFAAGFDSRAIRTTGEARALDVRVQPTLHAGSLMYALAGNGTLVYPELAPGRHLIWVDRSGKEERVKAGDRMYAHMRLSPDGTRVAAYDNDAGRDLWVSGLDGSGAQKLTSGPARDTMPVWSPDGKHIFFNSGEQKVFRVPADGSKDAEEIFNVPSPQRIFPLSITRDGKRLLVQLEELPKFDLGVLELGPPATLTRLTRSGTEGEGTLSPDGQWVAYQSKASTDRYAGRVIVRPFPDVERGLWVVSTGVGQAPIWSRDGRQIFYRTEDGTVMSVPITTAPAFRHGTPIPVVASPVNTIREGLTYAVSPDGQRFLFIRTPELDIRSLKVILNWDVEVKAMLAGTGAAPR